MPEDELEEQEEIAGDDLLEVVSDEDGNEILRTSANGTVIDDEEEEIDEEELDEVPAPVAAVPSDPAPDAEIRDAEVIPDVPERPGGNTEHEQVPQYNGFSVRPDGLGIYEPAYEDANSPEAELLIYGEVDEETGEVISQGIGEREYARRCGAYEVSKFQYESAKRNEIHSQIASGIDNAKREIEGLYPSLAKRFNVTEEEAQEFAPIYERAIELIDKERENRARQYIGAGYPGDMAILLANRDVLSVNGVFNMAFKSAAMEKEEEYDEIKWRLREKGKGNPAPARAEPPKEEQRLTPPQTATATSVPVKQAPARAEKIDLRGIPRAALEIAKQTGIDPRKLMEP